MIFFRPLTAAGEARRLFAATTLVTLVYGSLYIGVGALQRHAISEALKDPDMTNQVQTEFDSNKKNGLFGVPSAEVDGGNVRELRKIAKENNIPTSSKLYGLLTDSSLHRIFGWEQYFSFVLAAWAILLNIGQRAEVSVARTKFAGLTDLEKRAVARKTETLRSQLDRGLAVVRFVIWATPTIGFIGTVRHMGVALGIADDPKNISEITAFLGSAFDTTLIGLILSVILQLLQHSYERDEDDLLAAINAV